MNQATDCKGGQHCDCTPGLAWALAVPVLRPNQPPCASPGGEGAWSTNTRQQPAGRLISWCLDAMQAHGIGLQAGAARPGGNQHMVVLH